MVLLRLLVRSCVCSIRRHRIIDNRKFESAIHRERRERRQLRPASSAVRISPGISYVADFIDELPGLSTRIFMTTVS